MSDPSGWTALIVDIGNPRAVQAADDLARRYTFVAEDHADVGVVVGGDGFMLRTLHRLLDERRRLPLYGLNLGTVGFLLNRYEPQGLIERVAQAQPTALYPLQLRAVHGGGSVTTRLAINEVSLIRASVQTALLRVRVDGQVQMQELLGDGPVRVDGFVLERAEPASTVALPWPAPAREEYSAASAC